MGEWNEYVLEDVIDKFIDYRGKTPKKTTSGIPLVTAKVVKAGRILEPNEFIAEEDYDTWMTRGLPEIDDVVLTTEAPLGEVALVKNKNIALAQRIIALRGNNNYVHNPFLKYYFQSKAGQYELQSRASGTTVFGIKAAVLKKMPIMLPLPSEQKAIASVLSSLDDKINLLHRQNKTLEAMAETLFRQWFVEKAQEDWVDIRIIDLFEVRDGTHDSPKQTTTGKPLITSKHILDGRIDIANAYLISKNDFNKVNQRSRVDSMDILFSMIGTIGLIYLEQSEDIDYCIKNIGLFKASQSQDWAYYTYLWLKSPIGRQFIDEHKSGSTQEYVSLGSLRNIIFKKPSIETLHEFNRLVVAHFNKIKNNFIQIHTLEKLRDTLLPKLMSGEVRVDTKQKISSQLVSRRKQHE